MDFSKFNWRKVTDVNRDHAIFELVHESVILLDVSFSDDDVFEIAFHKAISNVVIDASIFLAMVERGRELAEHDK